MNLKPAHSDHDVTLIVKAYMKDPDWLYKTGVGGLINGACLAVLMLDVRHFMYLPIAIALSGLTTGFVLRTVRARFITEKKTKYPEWNNWLDLFVSGITWLAIQFGLCTLAAMLISSALIISVLTVRKGGGTLPVYEAALFFSLIVLFCLSYFSTYLMVNFAMEEKLAAGFAFRKVFNLTVLNRRHMISMWALGCSIQICAVLIPTITIIGIFVVPSIIFAAQIVAMTIIARAWQSSQETGEAKS